MDNDNIEEKIFYARAKNCFGDVHLTISAKNISVARKKIEGSKRYPKLDWEITQEESAELKIYEFSFIRNGRAKKRFVLAENNEEAEKKFFDAVGKVQYSAKARPVAIQEPELPALAQI